MAAQMTDKPLSIVLIDDDPEVLMALEIALKNTYPDIKITKAEDGTTAIEVCEQTKPELIVLDIILPKRSGFLVLEKVRETHKQNTKGSPMILMITGNLGLRHKQYAFSRGVDAYLWKPFRLSKFLEVVATLLAKQSKINNGQAP